MLTGVDDTSPLDAPDKPTGPIDRADQLVSELVVGRVFVKRTVKPATDLAPAIIDETGAAIGVAEAVVPEDHPVSGVTLAVLQKARDQQVTPRRGRVGKESCRLGGSGEKAHQIQVDTPGEGEVGEWLENGR